MSPALCAPSLVWRRPPVKPSLRPGELHLWRIPLAYGIAPEVCWGLLDAEARARTQSLRDPLLRSRYARARAGLRLILARYLGRPPQQIALWRTPSGKPQLTGEDGWLSLSFSHSGEIALVALSSGHQSELGVDCEAIRPRRHLLTIARRLFDPETAAALEAAPEGERLWRFYREWTALEARVKWEGGGLFGSHLAAADSRCPPRPQVAHFIPAAGYCAAVARLQLPPVEEWSAFELAHP